MVAAAKPLDEKGIASAIAFAQQVQALRPELRQQADTLSVAAFETREDIKRLATFPDEISPAEFADLKRRMTELLAAAATCLENTATMITALVGN